MAQWYCYWYWTGAAGPQRPSKHQVYKSPPKVILFNAFIDIIIFLRSSGLPGLPFRDLGTNLEGANELQYPLSTSQLKWELIWRARTS